MTNRPTGVVLSGVVLSGVALLLMGALLTTAGCSSQAKVAADSTLPEVKTVLVQKKDVPIYNEWIGTLDGLVEQLTVVQLYKALGGGWQ